MKFAIDRVGLFHIISLSADSFAEEAIKEIKLLQPVDDTTEEKADKIFKETGKYAWIMDDESAIDDWEHFRLRTDGDVMIKTLVNTNEYVENLNEGTMDKLVHGEPVERVNNGKFSEKSPNGHFIEEGLQKAMSKFFND